MQRHIPADGNQQQTIAWPGTGLHNVLGNLLRALQDWHRNLRGERVKAGLNAHLQNDIGHIDHLPRKGRLDLARKARTRAVNLRLLPWP